MLFAAETGRAPPVIASLDHLPAMRGGFHGRLCRPKKASLTGGLAEPARPEGLRPFAVIAYCPASGVGSASLPFPVCATSVSSRSPAMLTMTVTFSVLIFVPAL